jgi:hypothetical protein
MDILPKVEASHLSAAKQTTIKPTVLYSARQHANEVSSTSHVLKLAEMLLTDPAYKEKLKKVNVVVHPFTNPDGAQLAYDLQKITPNQMLHAGYLGPLGVDVTAGQNDPDPMYPETRVRRGGAARLLDDARVVDARFLLAGRPAVSTAQDRADETALDDHREREGGARSVGDERASLRSVHALFVRLRSEELQA